MPTSPSSQFTNPKVGLNMDTPHRVAEATGMIRNGVISSVRTMPRPRNFRSSSSAKTVPSTMAARTHPRV